MQVRLGKTELEIANFGPIVRANVEVRPFTVFVGPSNTGKSYLAILLYALHRYFGGRGRGLIGSAMARFKFSRQQKISEELIKEIVATVLPLEKEGGNPSGVTIPMSPLLADRLRLGFESRAEILENEICRCFGVTDTRSLIRKSSRSGAHIVVRRIFDDSPHTSHKLSLTNTRAVLMTGVPQELKFHRDDATHHLYHLRDELDHLRRVDEIAGDSDSWVATELLSTLANLMLPQIAAPLHFPAYYLPADRTGVMHAHNVVVSALIGSAPSGGLRPATQTPTLSGVLADFLEQLIEIDRPWHRRTRRTRDLGKLIEDAVLHGSVRISRSPTIDYPHFTYRPLGWKDDLPLSNASSMVSELAPVVLYLRHLVERDNVLVIEEPESHLHPGMQVELTRQLAKLVNAGIRIIVTTHSEWLLEELANIVKRSDLPKTKRDGKGALRPDQVGAWLFEPKKLPKGSVIREITLDESGTFPSGFDDVAVALHNDWAEISSSIEADS